MRFGLRVFQWIFWNAERISSLMAAAGVLLAVRIYRRKSALERATWLSHLYSKFYEAPDLKRIRKVLDDNPSDAPEVEELVRTEDSDLTDYLNFFEFMAYLEGSRQLSEKDVEALLTITCGFSRNTRTCEDMYWTIGTVTATSRDWWRVSPLKITGSDHDSPSFRIRHTLSAPRAPGDRRHRTAASPGGPGVGARSTLRSW
jgi:hypothetical protein